MAHKTMIGGTAYEIGGGKTLINGTGYSIDKGKTLVGGTAYEVGFTNVVLVTLIPAAGATTTCVLTIDGQEYRSYDLCKQDAQPIQLEAIAGTEIQCMVGSGLLGSAIAVDGNIVASQEGKWGTSITYLNHTYIAESDVNIEMGNIYIGDTLYSGINIATT